MASRIARLLPGRTQLFLLLTIIAVMSALLMSHLTNANSQQGQADTNISDLKQIPAYRFQSFELPVLVLVAFAFCLGNRLPAFAETRRSVSKLRTLPSKSGQLPQVSGRDSATIHQLTPAQYQVEAKRLDSFVRARDLEGFIEAADAIENKWGKTGGQHYGRLMLFVSDAIVNNFRSQRVFSLSQKYAADGLAKAATFSLPLEIQLLGFLTRDLAPLTSVGGAPTEWVIERRKKTKLWLHAWQRLEKGINRNFDFSDRPRLNVSPPDETGLPAGIVPEGIKDSKLRAEYEAALAANAKKGRAYNRQFELRALDETFPQTAEAYVVRVYSKPPYQTEELRRLLSAYKLNRQLRERLLSQVKRNVALSR